MVTVSCNSSTSYRRSSISFRRDPSFSAKCSFTPSSSSCASRNCLLMLSNYFLYASHSRVFPSRYPSSCSNRPCSSLFLNSASSNFFLYSISFSLISLFSNSKRSFSSAYRAFSVSTHYRSFSRRVCAWSALALTSSIRASFRVSASAANSRRPRSS
jgi:hypothetical protein